MQSGPMSPRQAPTKTFRFATPRSVPTQSRSHLAGLRGTLGHVFFRTMQSTNAGSNLSAAAPMQLMFPDGDLKWTSFDTVGVAWNASASATTAASTPGCYAHKIALDDETGHALHRPVGRPAARGSGREGRPLGLRRSRARLLGRPL